MAPFDITQPVVLKIRTSDGTAFLLRAASKEEREEWVVASNEAALACGRAATVRARDMEQQRLRATSASVSRGTTGGGRGGGDGGDDRDDRGQSVSTITKAPPASSSSSGAGAVEVKQVLEAAGLSASKYAQPLLALGVRSLEDLADQSVCSESMLRQEVGMNPQETAAFQKAIASALPQPPPSSPPSSSATPATTGGGAVSAEDDFMAALEAQATAQAAGPPNPPSTDTNATSKSNSGSASSSPSERPFVAKARNVLRNNPKNLTAWALVKDIDGSTGSKSKSSSRKVGVLLFLVLARLNLEDSSVKPVDWEIFRLRKHSCVNQNLQSFFFPLIFAQYAPSLPLPSLSSSPSRRAASWWL